MLAERDKSEARVGMHFQEALTIAARSMRANRLRSALTTLGIVIGVTAVIVLVGLGQGMKAGFNKSFGELATAITVDKVTGSVPGGGAPKELRDRDVQALLDKSVAPDVGAVIPVRIGESIVQYGPGSQFRATVTGSTTNYLTVNNREIVLGDMFNEEQARTNAKVVLLGPNPVANLYGGDAGKALGSTVRIDRASFKVIGVLGDSPCATALERLVKDRKINSRAIAVRRVESAQEASGTHLLFVDAAEEAHFERLEPAIEAIPVVTVGESPSFVSAGGAINFVLQGDNVRFEINMGAAGRAWTEAEWRWDLQAARMTELLERRI